MMRLLCAVALMMAAPGTALAAEDTPKAVVDAFHAALQGGKGEAALALLADDVLIFESGHAEQSKEEYAAGHLAADMEYEAAIKSTVTDRRLSAEGDVAWIATEGHSVGTFRGKDVNLMTTETMVLRRLPEGWRIVHIHWSSAGEH